VAWAEVRPRGIIHIGRLYSLPIDVNRRRLQSVWAHGATGPVPAASVSTRPEPAHAQAQRLRCTGTPLISRCATGGRPRLVQSYPTIMIANNNTREMLIQHTSMRRHAECRQSVTDDLYGLLAPKPSSGCIFSSGAWCRHGQPKPLAYTGIPHFAEVAAGRGRRWPE
jgi:hypothetical protein